MTLSALSIQTCSERAETRPPLSPRVDTPMNAACGQPQRSLDHEAQIHRHMMIAELEAARAAATAALININTKLREPLAAINDQSKLLSDCFDNLDQPDSRTRACETAASMCQSSLNLLNVLTKLLEWSDLEAESAAPQVAPVRLDELLARVEQQMRPYAEVKGLDLRTEVRSTARLDVASDSARLMTVLVQLVDNAIKFTPSGQVHVTLATTVMGAGGAVQLAFEVRDTGPGMSPEALGELQRRILRADVTGMRQLGGRGLGLAICRKVAIMLGGTLTIASRPRQGTTVTFIAQCTAIDPGRARDNSSSCQRTDAGGSYCRARQHFLAQQPQGLGPHLPRPNAMSCSACQ